MTDRESIVAYLRRQAQVASTKDAGDMVDRVAHAAAVAAMVSIANQIERGEDLKTCENMRHDFQGVFNPCGPNCKRKPPVTVADLLTLHDLDLGALAHKVGATADGLATAQMDALRAAYKHDNSARSGLAHGVLMDYVCESTADGCRAISTLGAKVRAALSAPPKATMLRILWSSDEAPCGSLWQTTVGFHKGRLIMRKANGAGRNIPPGPCHPEEWRWCTELLEQDFPARLIAEGLTEVECRCLSGMSAAEAIAWCERRAQGQEAMRRG